MGTNAKMQFDIESDSSGFVGGTSLAARAILDMQNQIASSLGRVNQSLDSTSKLAKKSAQVFEQAFSDQRQSMQRLIDAADPVAASMRNLASQEAQVNAALANGILTAKEHTLIMGSLGRAVTSAGSGYSRTNILIQQAGFQIADVAAVAAAGGSVFRGLGTQIGQFLGFMGPWGAVLGAGVTILGLLVTNMTNLGDSTDETKRKTDLYEKSLNDLLDIEKEYNKTLRERQGFASLDGKTENLKQRMFEDRYKAEDSSNSLSLAGNLWSTAKQKIGFGRTRTDFEESSSEASLSASDYQYGLELDEASKDNKIATTMGDLNEKRDHENVLMKIGVDERERAKEMMDAELEVRSKLKEAGADLSSDQVQSEIEQARAHAAAVYDQKQAEDTLKESIKEATKAREDELKEEIKQEDARNKISSGLQDEVDNNARLIEAMQTSEAEYSRVKSLLDIINKYRQAGIEMTPEEQKQAEDYANKLGEQAEVMDKLKEKHQSLNKLGSDLGMTFSSAFEDAIVQAKSLSDILQSLYQDVLRLFVRMTVTIPLESGMQDIFKSILPAIGFKSGTDSAPRGMAWVGEEGPELVNFRGGEEVYPSRLSRRLAAMSDVPGFASGAYDPSSLPSSSGDINISIIDKAGVGVTAQRKTTNGQDSLELILDSKVAKLTSQRGSGSNKALRQTFGAREVLVRR